jgi:DNA-binding response OmpR family regulator
VGSVSYKILVAEDELHIRKLVKDYLTNEGMTVIEAVNGEEAVNLFFKETAIDLVILDVMMPRMNGWEVCEEIRMVSDVPILFLTALSTTQDELKGLNIGADDYITKPFRYEIFMARIKSVLRRAEKHQKEVWQIGTCVVSDETREVSCEGNLIELSPKEYDLLVYFLKNINQALERQQILDAVWGYEFYGDPRTIDTHIKNLRSKLGQEGERIKTVRGFGYRMEGEGH